MPVHLDGLPVLHVRADLYLQTQYISSWYEIAPLPKAKSNKQRMDSLRLRAYRYVPERVWLPQRPVRPSIQALSMRIR